LGEINFFSSIKIKLTPEECDATDNVTAASVNNIKEFNDSNISKGKTY
jgi:hypothetical protein